MSSGLRLAVFLLVVSSSSAYGNNPITVATTFVRALYKPYGTGADPDYLGKSASRIFAPRLLRLIRADQGVSPGTVGKLDEDPLCDCQDDDGFRLFSIKTYPSSPGRATAKVSFVIGRVPRTIILDLTTIDRCWRIADVHSDRIRSLVSFLTNSGARN